MTSGKAEEAEVRFWALVNGPWVDANVGPYDCWLWMGGTCNSRRPKSLPANKEWKRYGRFRMSLEVGLINAHRAALLLTIGPPPEDGMVAGHMCDVPLCCNPCPEHLIWQTQKQNIEDALARGRLKRVSGIYRSTGTFS